MDTISKRWVKMKIKILKMLMVILMFNLILSSCMNVDFIVSVDKKYNCDLEINFEYENNYLDIGVEQVIADFSDEFQIVKTDKGYSLKTQINFNENFNQNSGIILPITDFEYTVNDKFYYNEIVINSKFSFDDFINKIDNGIIKTIINTIPKSMYDDVNINIFLNLPIKIGDSNADKYENNDKTAIWQFSLNEDNSIYLKQRVPNIKNIILSIFIGIILIVLIICAIKRYKDKINSCKNKENLL